MINEFYFEEDFVEAFSQGFQQRESKIFAHNAAVKASVFPVAVWPEFLVPNEAKRIKDELAGMEFRLRNSDLYEFHQTTDLKHVDPAAHPAIAQICNELYSPRFLRVMERVTGRKLGGHVDISGQRYQRGDFLLCHDDRLERRRIAMILYLVPEDGELRGGRLWAMRADEEGRPTCENPDTIVPKWNTLAFFEVTRASFHQVEQVLSEDVFRYSLTCWFHDAEEGSNEVIKASKKVDAQVLSDDVISRLLNDITSLGKQAFRMYFKGTFLSVNEYSDCEPEWIKCLLRPDFVKSLEQSLGVFLDWPTRPVAYLLSKGDEDFFTDSGVDHQKDFEYNYKERTVSESVQERLNVVFSLELDENNEPLGSLNMKIDANPVNFTEINPPKLLLICMKFTVAESNLRE